MVISPRAPRASADDARINDAASRDARTRDRVLALISERGPITAADLAADLGLTATGVRRHLDQLAESGAVTSRAPHTGKRGRGRPAREWVVGEIGHDHLTSDYDELAADAGNLRRGDDRVAQIEHSLPMFGRNRAGITKATGTDLDTVHISPDHTEETP